MFEWIPDWGTTGGDAGAGILWWLRPEEQSAAEEGAMKKTRAFRHFLRFVALTG